jgi:carbon storage regulator
MLTLTRKIGESVCIGDDIRVVVKEVKGKQVRLGIVAPRDIYVCREELYRKIHQANVGATSTDVNILDSISNLFGDKKRPKGGQSDES